MTRVRPATPTVAFVDQYCAHYRGLFHNVRHFEQFTALHLGLLAETRRKTLPQLGKTVHIDPQAFHHFLAHADWSVEALRHQRLELLRQALGDRPIIVCLDETGDRKKGHTTDYVATQYIGNLPTLANGIVSVNAYGLLGTTTFPLLFRLFKPESRLKPGDVYKTTPQLAVELVEELVTLGFRCSVVLADSEYGESSAFTGALHRLGLHYVVACTTWWPCALTMGSGCSRVSGSARRAGAPSSACSPMGSASSAFSVRRSTAPARQYAITRSPQTRRPYPRRRPGTS